MHIHSFMQRVLSRVACLNDHAAYCITGENEYPHFFFKRLFTFIKKNGLSFETIDVSSIDGNIIQSHLQTTFLGLPMLFCLSQLSDVKTTEFTSFLSTYTGPHHLIFFLPIDIIKQRYAKNKWQVITIPDTISRSDMQSFYPLFADEMQQTIFDTYIHKLYERYGSLSLEKICHLLSYAGLIGTKSSDHFLSTIGDRVIGSTHSLFMLAQDFFAHKTASFFKRWRAIEEYYPDQFWMSYWSNQLFRASLFVQCMRNKDQVNAKTLGARQLPFSFIERDWRRYQNNTKLIDAHQHLTRLDAQLKTTGYPYLFDIFFARFFAEN